MQNLNRLTRDLISVLQPVLDRSGDVLYSSAATIQPSPIYLLGNNPGGSPEGQADETILKSLSALPTKTANNSLDEAWTMANRRDSEIGVAPLQERVVWLLSALGLKPRDVPCSNRIFVRSINASGIDFNKLADLCWPAHERLLEIIDCVW